MANIGLRRSGRTTRQADANIQILFEEGACLIKDHHDHEASAERLQHIILKRLEYEHRIRPNDIIHGNTKDPNRLHGYNFPDFMINLSRNDIRYFYIILRDKKRHAPLDEDDKGNPIEELPDEEFHIPGMIHRKGVDPDTLIPPAESKGFQLGDAKQIPFLQKSTGSRFDKFNSK